MKIKLVQPGMTLRPMDSEYKRVMAPSLALLILAALTPAEHEVIFEDENTGRIHLDDSPSLVAVTVNVDTSHRAYDIARAYRARGILTVAGGIHASANPAETLRYFDAVCIGEAEGVWEQIVRDAASGCLQRVYRSEDAAPVIDSPPPRWDVVDRSRYLYTNTVCAGRGCPHACEFCYNSCDYISHRTLSRPVQNVVREIERLGTPHVLFIDDNFIGNIAWTLEFLAAIRPLRLTWNAAVSADLVHHPGLLDEMKACGCKSLFIGFESINPLSIRSVGKSQNKIETYESLIAMLHARQIMVNSSLVFGLDHDTPSVFQDTLDWLVRNRVETMTAHILTPYPGTKLYTRFLQEGRIVDFDPTHYNTSHAVFVPRLMSRQELKAGYLWIYKEFYTFGNIYRRLPLSPSQRTPYLLFNLVYRKFGKVTSRLAMLGLMGRMGGLLRRLSYNIE